MHSLVYSMKSLAVQCRIYSVYSSQRVHCEVKLCGLLAIESHWSNVFYSLIVYCLIKLILQLTGYRKSQAQYNP